MDNGAPGVRPARFEDHQSLGWDYYSVSFARFSPLEITPTWLNA